MGTLLPNGQFVLLVQIIWSFFQFKGISKIHSFSFLALLFFNVVLQFFTMKTFLTLASCYYWAIGPGLDFINHHRGQFEYSPDPFGREHKRLINPLPPGVFRHVKKQCTETARGSNIPSRAYYKLFDFLPLIEFNRVRVVLDVCAGRGGFTQAVYDWLEKRKAQNILENLQVYAYSFWNKGTVKHEEWQARINININDGDEFRKERSKLGTIPIWKVIGFRGNAFDKTFPTADLILFDGGESDHDYSIQIDKFRKLFRLPYSLIMENPHAQFFIKILNPTDPFILEQLENIRKITGRGNLIRQRRSRITNMEMYFVSTKAKGNLVQYAHEQAAQIIRNTHKAISEAYGLGYNRDIPLHLKTPFEAGQPHHVDPLQFKDLEHKGLDDLPKLPSPDYSDALKAFAAGRQMLPPTGDTTYFLKEVGRFLTHAKNPGGTIINPIVEVLVKGLEKVYPGIRSWKTTKVGHDNTYQVVLRKVDTFPKEDHQFLKKMKIAYKSLLKFAKKKGGKLNVLTDEEVKKLANRKGGLGREMRGRTEKNLGEYLDTDGWSEDVDEWLRTVKEGKPNSAVFNSMGKREKKKAAGDSGSRLIWFMSGICRLGELKILGGIYSILKLFNFSVSGFPLYDYGHILRSKWRSGYGAVCNDVAGWDTRISVAILRMECDFLEQLAEDEEHRKAIRSIYRIYANKIVSISRKVGPENEEVIFSCQGQRGSGEVITYAMNTITNAMVNLVALADTFGISDKNLEQFCMEILEETHPSGIKLVMSGDDSVVMGPLEHIRKFAQNTKFWEVTGMVRKNIPLDEPSIVVEKLPDIEFCSHRFLDVKFNTDKGVIIRPLPFRPVDEILGKARIMLEAPDTALTMAAWARVVGLNLLAFYPHVLEARLVGYKLLQGTPNNQSLQGLSKKTQWMPEPWLSCNTAIDVINTCCLGASSRFPTNARIRCLTDIQTVNPSTGGSYRKRWKADMIFAAQVIQKGLEEALYAEDWQKLRFSTELDMGTEEYLFMCHREVWVQEQMTIARKPKWQRRYGTIATGHVYLKGAITALCKGKTRLRSSSV